MRPLQPIEKQERIEMVDALRGLALLGILLANTPYTENPGSAADTTLNFLFHLLIEKKFITIFSMLFGFGFYVQLKRAEEAGINFSGYYLKRMLILLLIGCLHAYLFWNGDIIRNYALCGMALLFIYKWSSKRIIRTGILFSVVFTAMVFILNGAIGVQYTYDTTIVREHPVADSYLRYLWINTRTDSFVNFIQDSPITMVFCFGNMLIGFWMARSGFFQQPEKFNLVRKKLIIAGVLLGITASYVFWMITTGKLELTPALLWLPFFIVTGLLLQSLFYVSAFIDLSRTKARKLLSLFTPVGKMSLTAYLLQTVFYLLVFFHWTNGFRLYGKIGMTETYLIAIVFFAFQVLLCRLWLKYYDQGPVETLWKRLSYKFSNNKNSKVMKQKLVITVFCVLFSKIAFSQWETGAGLGISVPVTGYGEVLKTGWQLNADGRYRMKKGNFAIGMKAQFVRLQEDKDPNDAFQNARMTIAPLLFTAEFSSAKGKVQPYLSGGLGIIFFNLNYDTSPTNGETVFNVSFTMMPLVGLRYAPVGNIYPFIESGLVLLADGPPIGFPKGQKMTGYHSIVAGVCYRFR